MTGNSCPALTICQPYAELIASGAKPIENRTWKPSHRGLTLIHAGKSLAWLDRPEDKDQFVFGAIVAVADVITCLRKSSVSASESETWAVNGFARLYQHEHAIGPWCWVLGNVRRLTAPVPCAGSQGLWFPHPDVLSQVWANVPQVPR